MLLWETSRGKAVEVTEEADELSVADPRAVLVPSGRISLCTIYHFFVGSPKRWFKHADLSTAAMCAFLADLLNHIIIDSLANSSTLPLRNH